MLRRPFPFVWNDARNGGGNSGIPRRAPRLRALVQDFFSLPLHQETNPQQSAEREKPLKAESGLQIDATVRRRLRKGPTRKAIRVTERRTQISDGSIQVHIVKDVPDCNRKRQAIAVIRKIAVGSTRPAAAKTAALPRPPSTRSSAERTAGAWTATMAGVCSFRFFPKAKRFAQS